LIVCPLTALYASAKAMQEIFGLLKTAGTTRAAMDRLLPFQQFHDIIDLDGYYALDERYRAPDDTPGSS
jgi:2-methylisocitrate lyase-like PEP mutase family enzyme